MSTGSVGRCVSLLGKSSALSGTVLTLPTPSHPARYSFMSRLLGRGGSSRLYSSYPTGSSGGPLKRRKRTILDMQALKNKGVPITVLTAHDYPSARFIESAAYAPTDPVDLTQSSQPQGIDVCLVGDSLAMVACGYTSTTSLTLDEMLYHCRSVARGCLTSLLVADMPFGTISASISQAIANATRVIQEGNMDAVKIEGGVEVAPVIKALTEVGIPVMGHVGLTPQRQSALSGYRVQGKSLDSAMAIYKNAMAVQEAGAFSIVLEAIPAPLAQFVTERLTVPTIGIGAGSECDGQVLVQLDMMGARILEKGPRFLKEYAKMEQFSVKAVSDYAREVREKGYPTKEHEYPFNPEEWQKIKKELINIA